PPHPQPCLLPAYSGAVTVHTLSERADRAWPPPRPQSLPCRRRCRSSPASPPGTEVSIDQSRNICQQHRGLIVNVKAPILAVPAHHSDHIAAVPAFDEGDIAARAPDGAALRGHRDHRFRPGLQETVVLGDPPGDVVGVMLPPEDTQHLLTGCRR